MISVSKRPIVAFTAAAALMLAGCADPAPSAPGAGSTMPAPSSASSPAEAGATSTSPAPSSTTPSSAAGEPTVLPTTASVTVFYVAENDGGVSGPTFGCGDVAVAVTSPSISFTDPVEGALRVLLENRTREIGQSGLSNALWQSRLEIDSIERMGNTVTVNLTGTLSMGGECDIPRVQLQLLLTAQQAAGGPVDLMLNGKPLSEALSLK